MRSVVEKTYYTCILVVPFKISTNYTTFSPGKSEVTLFFNLKVINDSAKTYFISNIHNVIQFSTDFENYFGEQYISCGFRGLGE